MGIHVPLKKVPLKWNFFENSVFNRQDKYWLTWCSKTVFVWNGPLYNLHPRLNQSSISTASIITVLKWLENNKLGYFFLEYHRKLIWESVDHTLRQQATFYTPWTCKNFSNSLTIYRTRANKGRNFN